MGRLFDLVEEYRHRFDPHPPSYSEVAEQVGVSKQTLSNWRTPAKLPNKEHLVAFARATRLPYARVLDAALEDIGYLREEQASISERRREGRGPKGRKEQPPD